MSSPDKALPAVTLAAELADQIDELGRRVHAQLLSTGAYDVEPMPEWALAALKAGLIASEAFELVEEIRAGREHEPSDKVPTITKEEDEYADMLARVLDYGAKRGLRGGYALAEKMRFNAFRPYKHGGKRF